jgi:leishmanolysin
MFLRFPYCSVPALLVLCLVHSRPLHAHVLIPPQPRRNYTLAPPRPYVLEEDNFHECIHDAAHVQDLIAKNLARSAKLMADHPSIAQHQFHAAQSSTPESIRIVVSTQDLEVAEQYCPVMGHSRPDLTNGESLTCMASEVLTAAKKDLLLNQLLPTALARLTSRIKVKRYTSNLVVSRQACLYFTIPDSHSTTGVPEADFVLYVAAGPINGSTTLAWAGSCQSDPTTGRPTVGCINIDPDHLEYSNAAGYETLIDTIAHEIMHALGFSAAMFAIPSRYGTTTRRGKPVKQLVTEGIVAEAQDFTGCASLDGVELEDEGTGGSVGSHFERRLYKDELMTAAGGTQLSRLSLKMLEDLNVGYTVDLSTAEQMIWGRLTGCGFHTEPCNTTLGGRDTYFCFDETAGATFCTRSRDGIGPCSMTNGTTPLPDYFQYFADPTKGGSAKFMDSCPYVQAYGNRVCTDAAHTATESETYYGYTFGPDARCIRTSVDFLESGYSDKSRSAGGFRCVKTRCIEGNTRLQLQVRSQSWANCPVGGTVSAVAIPGYAGAVVCPAANAICGDPSTAAHTQALMPSRTTPSALPAGKSPATPGPSTSKTNPPTAVAVPAVRLMAFFRVSGSAFKQFVDDAELYALLSMAVQRDLANLLRVPMYLVLINSLKLGSLIVNFTVLDDPSAELDHVAAAFTAGVQTSSWLADTCALYVEAGSDNPALDPASGAILFAMEAKATEAGSRARGSSTLLYAAISGGATLAIFTGVVIMFCIRRRRSITRRSDARRKEVSPTTRVTPAIAHMPLADTSIADQSLEIYSRSTEPFFDDSFMDVKVEPHGHGGR